MTDREMVLHLIKKLGRKIWSESPTYIEFDSDGYSENVSVEFTEDGDIVDMY